MSDVFDLTDAVAARINAGAYTIADTFTASGVPLVEFDMDELSDDVAVECVPMSNELTPITRTKDRSDITIATVVLKRVGVVAGKASKVELAELTEFCEELASQLRGQDYTINGRKASWLSNEIDPIYDSDALYSHQLFRSQVKSNFFLTTP